MLAEISRKIPIWDYDLTSIRFCGWIEVYEAEKNSSFFSFSAASTTATEIITCESAKCPFPGKERKTCNGGKNVHLCCGEENHSVMCCFLVSINIEWLKVHIIGMFIA